MQDSPQFANRKATVFAIAVLVASLSFYALRATSALLSDDFVHANWVHEANANGTLAAWLTARFYAPLESGNFAYRPIAFCSYALDYLLHGSNAAGWFTTSLLIHLCNCLLLHWWLRRLQHGAKHFGPFAAALSLGLTPFAGESIHWAVGRFDLLACFFLLIFLGLTAIRDTPSPCVRYLLAPLALLAGLLSKESAMPMIFVASAIVAARLLVCRSLSDQTNIVAARTALTNSFLRLWPSLMTFALYLATRKVIFGSVWRVYPESTLPQNFAELIARIGTMAKLGHVAFDGHASTAGALAAFVIVLVAIRRRVHDDKRNVPLAILLGGAAICYLLAPASSFAIIAENGEGSRNLYLGMMLSAAALGLLLQGSRFRGLALAIALMVSGYAHFNTAKTWRLVAAEMAGITAAVPALAKSIRSDEYALILLPDHVGPVPFLRNAQGGIVSPPVQRRSYLDKLAGMTPLQFTEWSTHLQTNTIAGLKHSAEPFDSSKFVGVFCWQSRAARFVALKPPVTFVDGTAWGNALMIEAGREGCLL